MALVGMKFLAIICVVIIGAAGGLLVINHITESRDNNVVVFSSQGGDFHDLIKSKSVEVNNSVTAMLLGQENPSDTLYIIGVRAEGTSHDGTYSQEQREINGRYRSYLDSAQAVTMDYINEDKNLTNDVKIMNMKKDAI